MALPFFAEPFGDGAGFASSTASEEAFAAAFAGGAGFAGRNTCAAGGGGVGGEAAPREAGAGAPGAGGARAARRANTRTNDSARISTATTVRKSGEHAKVENAGSIKARVPSQVPRAGGKGSAGVFTLEEILAMAAAAAAVVLRRRAGEGGA